MNLLIVIQVLFLSFFSCYASAETSPFYQKNILVTGGAGSVGSILVEEILKHEPKKVLIFSRDELKHFYLLEKFKNDPRLRSVLGDVRDFDRLLEATKNVDLVIHSAALKRIDSIEENVEESIKTNVQGTQNVFNACCANKVKKAILISTDKACLPVCAYGAGKLLAEKIFTNYDKRETSTEFSVVRFGNLVGSSGSIIPIFLGKIKKGEEIPLTDSAMTRFMMTDAQVVEVVIEALKYGSGGEIFVKKLPSMRIVDVIESMKTKTQSKNKIKITGIRPGERINELLINETESARTFLFNDNYIITPTKKTVSNEVPIYVREGIPLQRQIPKELQSDKSPLPLEMVQKFINSLECL